MKAIEYKGSVSKKQFNFRLYIVMTKLLPLVCLPVFNLGVC